MKTKENKGITLIALIVTIIVMIILAGVTISTISGDSGIIAKANEAKKQTEIKEVIERNKLDISNQMMENGGKSLTRNQLKDILERYFKEVPEDYTIETELTAKDEYGNHKIKISEIFDINSNLTDDDDSNPEEPEETIKYTLSLDAGSGTIIGSSSYDRKEGEIIIIPNPKSPNSYNLYLDLNDGTNTKTITSSFTFNGWKLSGEGTINGSSYTFGNGNGTLVAQYSQNEITLTTPTREGYTFKGWYTSATGGTKVGDGGSKYIPKTNNIRLYAKWQDETKPEITSLITLRTSITIVATDSGSGIVGYAISTSDDLPETFSIVDNTPNLNVTIDNLSEGTTYYVWVKDASENISEVKSVSIAAAEKYILSINAGAGINEGKMNYEGKEGETITIPNPTAPSTYTLYLNSNYGANDSVALTSSFSFNGWELTGEGKITENTYTFGSGDGVLTAQYTQKAITLIRATREGYTFKGWYTSATGGTKVGNGGDQYTPASNNITLYAQWKDETAPKITNIKSNTTSLEISATDSGSGIDGYVISTQNSVPSKFIEVDNTNNLNITINNLSEETLYYVWVRDASGNISEVKSATTLKTIKYTLSINAGVGTAGGSTSYEGKEGETITIPNPTAPSTYTVYLEYNDGTYGSMSLRSSFTFNGWSLSGKGTINGNTYTFGEGDGVLTAQYSQSPITLSKRTRDGYTLNGWYTSATGGTKVGNGGDQYTPASNNITLYAQWKDETKPEITSLIPSGTSLGVIATDSGSGIVGYVISNQNSVPSKFTEVDNTNNLNITINNLSEGETYYVWVKDASGNISEVKSATIPKASSYTLSINAGAGTAGGSLSYEGKKGETITIPNPTAPSAYTIYLEYNDGTYGSMSLRSSFTFNGWSLSGKGTISGNTYTFGEGDGVLTAQYSQSPITLSKRTRDGYTLNGWYTSATGGTKVGNGGDQYTPTYNGITLYAQWQAQEQLSYVPIFTPSTTEYTKGPITVSVSSPVSGYTVQTTIGDPEVSSNWTNSTYVTFSENGTLYARLTNGTNTLNYAEYKVTNIFGKLNAGKGALTISRDNSKNTVYLQIHSILGTVNKMTMYYKVEGDSTYKSVDYDFSSSPIQAGGSVRLAATDSNFSGNTARVYAVATLADGTKTISVECTISYDGSVTSYGTY